MREKRIHKRKLTSETLGTSKAPGMPNFISVGHNPALPPPLLAWFFFTSYWRVPISRMSPTTMDACIVGDVFVVEIDIVIVNVIKLYNSLLLVGRRNGRNVKEYRKGVKCLIIEGHI